MILSSLRCSKLMGQCSEINFEKNNYLKQNEKLKQEKYRVPSIESNFKLNEVKRDVNSKETFRRLCPVSETSKITLGIAHNNLNSYENRTNFDSLSLLGNSIRNVRNTFERAEEHNYLNNMFQSLMDNISSYLSLAKNKREATYSNEVSDKNFNNILDGAGQFLNNLIHDLSGDKFKTHGHPSFHNHSMYEDLRNMNIKHKYRDNMLFKSTGKNNGTDNNSTDFYNLGIINENDIDKSNKLFKIPTQEKGSVDRKYVDLMYGMNMKSRLQGLSNAQDIEKKPRLVTSKTQIYSDFHPERDSELLPLKKTDSILNGLEHLKPREKNEENNEEFIRKIVDEEICKVLKLFRDSLRSTFLSNNSISSNLDIDREGEQEVKSLSPISVDGSRNDIPSEGINETPSDPETREHFPMFENDTSESDEFYREKNNEMIQKAQHPIPGNDTLKNKKNIPKNDTDTLVNKDNTQEENSKKEEEKGEDEEEKLKEEPSQSTVSASKQPNLNISNKRGKNSIHPESYSDYFWKLFKSEYMLKNEINNKGRPLINTQPKHQLISASKFFTPPSPKSFIDTYPVKDRHYFTTIKNPLIDNHQDNLDKYNHGNLKFSKYSLDESTPNIDSDKNNNIPFHGFNKFVFRSKSPMLKLPKHSEEKENELIVNRFRNYHKESFSQINKNYFQENNPKTFFEHTSLKANFLENPIKNISKENNVEAGGYNKDFNDYLPARFRNRGYIGNFSEINKNQFLENKQNIFLEPTATNLKFYDFLWDNTTRDSSMAIQDSLDELEENTSQSPLRFKPNDVQIENVSEENIMPLINHRNRPFFKDISSKENILEASKKNVLNGNNPEALGDQEVAPIDSSTEHNEPIENTSEFNEFEEYIHQNISEETSKLNDYTSFETVTNKGEKETQDISRDHDEYFQASIPRFKTKDIEIEKESEGGKIEPLQNVQNLFDFTTYQTPLEENKSEFNDNNENNFEATSSNLESHENVSEVDLKMNSSAQMHNNSHHNNHQELSDVSDNNTIEENAVNSVSKPQNNLNIYNENQQIEFRISTATVEDNMLEEQLKSFQVNYPTEVSAGKFKITKASAEKSNGGENGSAGNDFVTLIVPISDFKEMLKKQIYNKSRRLKTSTMFPSGVRKKYFYFKRKHPPPNTKVIFEQSTSATENNHKMRKLAANAHKKYNQKMTGVHNHKKIHDPHKVSDTEDTCEHGKVNDPANAYDPSKVRDPDHVQESGHVNGTSEVCDPSKMLDPSKLRDPGFVRENSNVHGSSNLHDIANVRDSEDLPESKIELGNSGAYHKNPQEVKFGNSTINIRNDLSHCITFKKSPDSNKLIHGGKRKYIKVVRKQNFSGSENHSTLRKPRYHKARPRYQNTNQAGFEIEGPTSNLRFKKQPVNFIYDNFDNYDQYPHKVYRKKKYNEQYYYY